MEFRKGSLEGLGRMIRLSKSCIGEAEKQAVLKVLEKEYLGMGEEVQAFERALTEFFGRPAVCVNTGTSALHLACQAIGSGPGDEILIPTITYVASFQAAAASGATPIACDVREDDLLIDLDDAETRLTSRTRAIMPVFYASNPGHYDEVYAFAQKHGLRVVEDAAHAFGCSHNGKRIGSMGDIACFSFDGIKNITSAEGGAIVTEDRKILDLVRDARLLGVEKDTEARYQNRRSWEFNVTAQGWRYHMSNVNAAIGIEQLKRFDGLSERRRLVAASYFRHLEGSGIKLLPLNRENIVPHIYVVLLPTGSRDSVRKKLEAQGIQTGIHYFPNHRLTLFTRKGQAYPSADRVYEQILTLPMHPDLTENDVIAVCNVLKSAISS